MSISNTFSSLNQPKSILSNLKLENGLPFQKILSMETIAKSLQDLEYRERFFTPNIVLLAFLSQVIDDDHSQQAAVARVIAFFAMLDLDSPSANTSVFEKNRTDIFCKK